MDASILVGCCDDPVGGSAGGMDCGSGRDSMAVMVTTVHADSWVRWCGRNWAVALSRVVWDRLVIHGGRCHQRRLGPRFGAREFGIDRCGRRWRRGRPIRRGWWARVNRRERWWNDQEHRGGFRAVAEVHGWLG